MTEPVTQVDPTPQATAEIPADTALGAQVAEATQPEDTRPVVEFRGKTFTLRKKPSAKYIYLGPRDPMGALECVMPVKGDFEKLLDMDLDFEDLSDLDEAMAKAWGVENKGN